MQLTFPNGEHKAVALGHGEISIGSDAARSVCLAGVALAPHHASIICDRRGLWLHVPAGKLSVHVNARPVHALALLRIGDLLCLEQVQALVSEDDVTAIGQRIPVTAPAPLADGQRASASRVVLRAVSGSHFGRSFSLADTKVIGRSSGCDIRIDDPALAERHAQFELHTDRVVLRALCPNEGSQVNGIAVRDAILYAGDQIVVDQHRFILEAPGLPERGKDKPESGKPIQHTQTIKSLKQPETLASDLDIEAPTIEAPSAVDPGALWWLIAAAAVLAAAMTALLVYSPGYGAA